jgi:hypothetical protein
MGPKSRALPTWFGGRKSSKNTIAPVCCGHRDRADPCGPRIKKIRVSSPGSIKRPSSTKAKKGTRANLNADYKSGVNPCRFVLESNGKQIAYGAWDTNRCKIVEIADLKLGTAERLNQGMVRHDQHSAQINLRMLEYSPRSE